SDAAGAAAAVTGDAPDAVAFADTAAAAEASSAIAGCKSPTPDTASAAARKYLMIVVRKLIPRSLFVG
ncbi:hypothetical protein PQR33_46140, partial [Paraburkholderia sediminicola]|uniref:hypothetical protein n=1 Tax=Paraburkholderia sediminicola TaxID=458836 RepID=UPI0038B830A8